MFLVTRIVTNEDLKISILIIEFPTFTKIQEKMDWQIKGCKDFLLHSESVDKDIEWSNPILS